MTTLQALPKSTSFYTEILERFLSKGRFTRLELSEKLNAELDGKYDYNMFNDIHYSSHPERCKAMTCQTIYLKVHSALQKLKNNISKKSDGKQVYYMMKSINELMDVPTETIASTPIVEETKKAPKKSTKKASNKTPIKVPRKVNGELEKMIENNKIEKEDVRNHFVGDNYKMLESLIKMKYNVLLKGIPGTGKTRDLMYYSFKHDLPCFHLTFTEDTAIWNLVGRSIFNAEYRDIKEGGSNILENAFKIFNETWVYGILALACINASLGNKTVLIIDEINLASPAITTGVLNSVLNENKLTIQDINKVIKWDKKNLVIGATMNPDLIGTNELNEALESRFVKMEYEIDNYIEIVQSYLGTKSFPSNEMKKIITSLADAKLDRSVGLREFIFFTELEMNIEPINKGNEYMKTLMVNQIGESDKLKFINILSGVLV